MSHQKTDYRKTIFGLIGKLSGPGNILSVNKFFCKIGGLEFGLFLSQLLYWCDKGRDKDGWFYKSYKEWEEEIFVSERTLRRLINDFKEMGWLETKVKRVGNNPTLHFRIDQDKFYIWIESIYQGSGQNDTNHVPAKLQGTEDGNLAGTIYTSITTPNTQELQTTVTNKKAVRHERSRTSKSKEEQPRGTMIMSELPKKNQEEPFGSVVSLEQDVDFYKEENCNVQKEEFLKGGPPERAVTVEEIVREDKAKDEKVLAMWGNMAKQASSRYEIIHKWARGYKILSNVPDYILESSYLIYELTGFQPEGSKKGWISAVSTLWNACKSNEGILKRALQEGEKARRESGLTFSGPRSYVNFARNISSLVEKEKILSSSTRRLSQEERNEQNGTGKTYTRKDGTQVVKVN